MDEVEKYQQRLRTITEKRRLQEEEDRMKREMEEERLKEQQLKRMSLRDQWLMDALPVAPDSSENESSPREPQTQGPKEQQRDPPQAEGSQLAKEEQKDLEDTHSLTDRDPKKAGVFQVETAGGAIKHQERWNQERWTQEGVKGRRPDPCIQTALLKNGQQERSVLGVVELQVERDLKTGATVILSVAPMAPGQTGTPGKTVFDDGRRTVQAVGVVGATPSPEELGQILDVLTGAGLQALLGDTKVIPNRRGEEQGAHDPHVEKNGIQVDTKAKGDITHSALQQEVMPSTSTPGRWESPQLGEEGAERKAEEQGCPATMATEAADWGGPVTMTFLGFAEAEPGGEDAEEVICAERVIISDEGDELPLPESTEKSSVPPTNTRPLQECAVSPTQQASALPDSTPTSEGGAETDEGVFLEPTPLQQVHSSSQAPPNDAQREGVSVGGAGGGARPQQDGTSKSEAQNLTCGAGQQIPATSAELQPLVHHSKENPTPERGEPPPKRKSCHCCSVM